MQKFDAKRKLMLFADGLDWDSTLFVHERDDGGNLNLKLRIRVFFRSVDVKTGPNTGYYQEEDDRFGIDGWDRILWEQWKREYCRVIENYWNHRFWLVTPKDYDELNYGSSKPNLTCNMVVEPVIAGGGAHYTFNVIRIADYRVNRALSGGHGYTGWLADVGRGADPDNDVKLVNMKTVAHIFALPHKGREYANHNRYFRLQAPVVGTGDLTAQQGTTQDRTYHPGVLHGRELFHARPWQVAMERHTGKSAEAWRVMTSRIIAQNIK
jgi:hypothetical protein